MASSPEVGLKDGEEIKQLDKARLLEILGASEIHQSMKVSELRHLCRAKYPNHSRKRVNRDWGTPSRGGESGDEESPPIALPPVPSFPAAPDGQPNPLTLTVSHREHGACDRQSQDTSAEVCAEVQDGLLTPLGNGADTIETSVDSHHLVAPAGPSTTSALVLGQHREIAACVGEVQPLATDIAPVSQGQDMHPFTVEPPPTSAAVAAATAATEDTMDQLPLWTMAGATDAEVLLQSSPGSKTDLYVPVRSAQASEPQSKKVWFFFRRRYSDDHLYKTTKLKQRAWCIIEPCESPCVPTGGGTTNLRNHLERHHGLTVESMEEQSQGRCRCGCKGKPHGNDVSRAVALATARVQLQMAAAQKLNPQASAQSPDAKQEWQNTIVVQPLNQKPQVYLSKQFARMVCVGGLRESTLASDPGMKAFLALLLSTCRAQFGWSPPDKSAICKTIRSDALAMWAKADKMYQLIPETTRSDHHDCWTDQWKRHWVCSYTTWLDDDFFRHFFVYCLRTTGSATSHLRNETGGTQAADVVSSIIKRAWTEKFKAGMSKWGHSDNATAAVAVTHNLAMAEERCTAHAAVIPINRTLKPIEVAKDRKSPPPKPPCPQQQEAMDVAQEHALCYFHHEERERAFQKFRSQLSLSIAEAPTPKPYGSKWCSMKQLAQAMHLSRSVLEEMEKSKEQLAFKLPCLPTGEQFDMHQISPKQDVEQNRDVGCLFSTSNILEGSDRGGGHWVAAHGQAIPVGSSAEAPCSLAVHGQWRMGSWQWRNIMIHRNV